jgi:hypothetical protein
VEKNKFQSEGKTIAEFLSHEAGALRIMRGLPLAGDGDELDTSDKDAYAFVCQTSMRPRLRQTDYAQCGCPYYCNGWNSSNCFDKSVKS